jgi:hypothetical protein
MTFTSQTRRHSPSSAPLHTPRALTPHSSLDNAHRTDAVDLIPTTEDYLRAHQKSFAVTETRFNIGRLSHVSLPACCAGGCGCRGAAGWMEVLRPRRRGGDAALRALMLADRGRRGSGGARDGRLRVDCVLSAALRADARWCSRTVYKFM